MLEIVSRRLAEKGIILTVTEEAAEFIAQKGYDPAYGARPLRRVIRTYLEDPAARLVLEGLDREKTFLKLFLKNGELFLEPIVKEYCDPQSTTKNNNITGE